MEVVKEEPGERSHEERRVGGARAHLAHVGKADEKRGGGDEPDAGGEPVHVVEQVERVGDAHHPQDGEHRVEGQRLDPMQPISEEHQ
jgi:hypothetical protein